ncbi:beta-galactosidase 15-like [Mercurialis annua]|uniref:beta-galactosidase 15-like n=1 Tax=Mercurialis annua TaxID=3986 RepID=UPI00215E3AEC|nr:beta-galactosidase 15-like [Mercurialis annua]
MEMVSSRCLVAVLTCFFMLSLVSATIVSHNGRAITIDGKPRVLLSGSMHYPRSTPGMWPDLVRKAKEGGLDAIETYVFWNSHEPSRRQYDFSGNLDLVRFIKTVQAEGLYVVLRIGPYVCAEWNYGGFPMWLHNMPGCELRTTNAVFMNEMQNFTTKIVDMMKEENLFASEGGPIILAQVENEYGNVMHSYGAAGKAYIDWCANMAESLDVGVPWIMCQQSDAPQPMINTCNGWYCDQFTPNNPNSPKMWTENWTGWFKSWGGKDPHRTAEDLAFAVARFFQTGGTFQNYYMFHGGTNFGRTAGGPYITTSYDYDAPLDEYGNLNQPKYGHLKQLHDILHSMEYTLTHGNISHIDYGNSVTATIYANEQGSGCFFGNANQSSDATIEYQGTKYTIPAWSVSILPDCKTVGYNSAKVKTQTTLLVKQTNQAEDEPSSLTWSWIPENTHRTSLLGKGRVHAHQLVDQKAAANDASDYLWYMTSVHLKEDDPVLSFDTKLRINATGQVLHAYVNGKHMGSQFARYGVSHYVFEESVKLKPGKNVISLLSATVGLPNYGPMFDLVPSGIPGPVELIGQKDDETVVKDISSHTWSYSVGLDGFNHELYASDHSKKWMELDLPTDRMMTWYKTTFKAPLGKDPVVLDMDGMGKGFAWVNGNNIGRYWPTYLADEEGCSLEPCDYRGAYDNNKCVTNCGKPTQRWYHVPRSFLVDGENTLVLFEEFGGNPGRVNFQTITAGKVGMSAAEGEEVELSCNGKSISGIEFASFGNPQGSNGDYMVGTCQGSNDTLSIVQKACVGKESCKIEVSKDLFGSTNCGADVVNTLAVLAVC